MDLFAGETQLKKEMMDLIIRSEAYDKNKRFINLDNLWSKDIDIFKDFCTHFGNYTKLIREQKNFDKIIIADKAAFPIGILPIISTLSLITGIQIVIWKEWANIPKCESKFYGDLNDRKIAIMHDVTSMGTTAVKIMCDLNLIKFSGKLEMVLSVFDLEKGAGNYIQEKGKEFLNYDVEFHPIFNISDLEKRPDVR